MTEESKEKIQKLIEEKNYEEAIKLCDEAIEKDNKDEEAYSLKTNCYFDLKDYNTSIEILNKLIEINPNYEKAYFNRGLSKSYLKMYEEALKDFDISIKLNPNIDRTYFEKSIILFDIEKYEEAIINLNKAIELNPTYEDAYFNIGRCQFELKNYDEAIKYFNKVIELSPKEEGAYYNIGLIKIELENYIEAIEYFNKVIELNPKEEGAYYNIAYSKVILKKYEDAIIYINKVIELNPKNEHAYYLMAGCQYDLKKYNSAIEYYNKVIKLNNNNKYAYFLKSICKVYLKNENAIEDLRSFFKINQDNNIYIIKILELFEEYTNIEKLFKFIVDIKNNELWYNEPITNLISRFEESKNFDDELKENIKYLLLYEYFLLKLLTFDTEEENNNIEISHYTSLYILTLLLNVKENTKESGNIRINNITTANDHKEGKILESILNKNNIDIQIENDEKALTLQTSYSRNKDSLTMFRLYGKKENKEATGVCLVLDNKYFNNSYTSPYYYEFKLKIENNKISMNEEINKEKFQENKRNLYWVLYYNEKENQLVYNKEKSKYASNIIDLDDLNNDDYKAELKEDDKKEDIIKYAFSKIFHYTREIKKQIEDPKNNEIYKNIKNQLYSYLFENIKYIIKHEAFFEEQELRMLVTNDYKSDEILIDNDNKKLYIDYIKLFNENTNYIKEIIIGSKVENNEAVAEYIRKALHLKNTEANKLDDIKVSISEAPLR